MKKSIIAASAASLAVAALPVVGVFAATPNSFTDTLTVTVQGGCTLENSTATAVGVYDNNDRDFSATISAGTVGYLNASSDGATPGTSEGSISVKCNDTSAGKTWTVSADVTNLTDGTNTIAGGIATSGATSAWAIKSNATNVAAANDPFASYAAAADTAAFLSAAANQAAATTFNPSYRVYVSPNQPAGEYEGSVVYEVQLSQ